MAAATKSDELEEFGAGQEETYRYEVPPIQRITKQNNILPIWKNTDTMNLNHMVLQNINISPYFKKLGTLKTYAEVIDELYYYVTHLEPWEKGTHRTAGQTGMCGGVRGVGAGGVVSTPFCILYKLFTLRLTRKQLVGTINHTDSPYIRALGFMYIRFCQPPETFWEWFEPYFDDEEEVDPKAGGGEKTTMGQLVKLLLTKLDWYGTLFPRIPVPIQKDLDQKLRDYNLKKFEEAKRDRETKEAEKRKLEGDQPDERRSPRPDFREREKEMERRGESLRRSHSTSKRSRSRSRHSRRPSSSRSRHREHRRRSSKSPRRSRGDDQSPHSSKRSIRSSSRSRDEKRHRSSGKHEHKKHKRHHHHRRHKHRSHHRRDGDKDIDTQNDGSKIGDKTVNDGTDNSGANSGQDAQQLSPIRESRLSPRPSSSSGHSDKEPGEIMSQDIQRDDTKDIQEEDKEEGELVDDGINDIE